MIIIGIHCGHDSSVTVLQNGKNIFSLSEERLSRQKNHKGMPKKALAYIFENNIVDPLDVKYIASTSFIYDDDHVLYPENEKEPAIHRLFQSFGCKDYELKIFPHHLAHSASVYYGSGWDDALVITSDGEGDDGLSGSVCTAKNGQLKRLNTVPIHNSVGQMYTAVTSRLGFTPSRHEGKITGLAAYGKETEFLRELREIAWTKDGSIQFSTDHETMHVRMRDFLLTDLFKNPVKVLKFVSYYFHKKYIKQKQIITEEYHLIDKKYNREDLSYGVQVFSEDIICDWISYWKKKTGLKRIALAGGVFANVKINQRITERCGIDEIFRGWHR